MRCDAKLAGFFRGCDQKTTSSNQYSLYYQQKDGRIEWLGLGKLA